MKYLEKIQTLLPLGYLYLIVLGLLKEGVLYYRLGINILNYSSITDILISPVSDLASEPALILAVIVIFSFFFIIQTLIVKNSHTNWAKKILGQNRFGEDTSKKEIRKVVLPYFIIFLAFELLCIFVGLGVGRGGKLSERISQGSFQCNYKITLNNGKSEDAYLFDLNSSYGFYLIKGTKNIKIVPVANIGTLELLNDGKTTKN